MKIILASASERRHELLKRIIEKFDIKISDFDEETVKFNGDFGQYVMELAKGKAELASYGIKEESIIIGCDTIVAFDKKVLGKPRDKDEAYTMLKRLSGNVHQVYSGIALINTKDGTIKTDYVCTDVNFSNISEDEIYKYVATGEPMDKAGAYGIQGKAGVFVEKIYGCYYNVVGLPLNRLNFMLREMGVNL